MSTEVFYKVGDLEDFESLLVPAQQILGSSCEFHLAAPDTPPEFQEVGRTLGKVMAQEPNVLIVNRHNGNRDLSSYKFQSFPKRFVGRVAIVSLDNLAYTYTLVSSGSDGLRIAKCDPGTTLLMEADLRRVESPPLEGSTRHTLLLGFDSTKKPAN